MLIVHTEVSLALASRFIGSVLLRRKPKNEAADREPRVAVCGISSLSRSEKAGGP